MENTHLVLLFIQVYSEHGTDAYNFFTHGNNLSINKGAQLLHIVA